MTPIVREVRVQLGNGRTDIRGHVRPNGVSVRIWTPPTSFRDTSGSSAAIELTREQWREFVTDMDTLLRGGSVSGYGEVVREMAEETYERHVSAIEAVLRREAAKLPPWELDDEMFRAIAEECLAAAEVGF